MGTINCTQCGNSLAADSQFCDLCGQRVDASGYGTVVSSTPSTPAADPSATMLASQDGRHATVAAGASPGGAGMYVGAPVPPTAAPGPYYPPQAATPAKGNVNWVLLGVGAAILLVAGFFGGTQLFGDDEASPDTQAAPAVTAETAAANVPSTSSAGETLATNSAEVGAEQNAAQEQAAAQEQVAAQEQAAAQARADAAMPSVDHRYSIYNRSSGYGGAFPRAAALTQVTSAPFVRSVANAYAASGANGSSIVLSNVYSPVTGRPYTMSCSTQADRTVICSGGDNARVLLYAR